MSVHRCLPSIAGREDELLASWTNDLSWVEGYANLLEPMNQLRARFHQHFDPLVAQDPAVTRPGHTRRPCSTCCCWKPAASATGARASGPTMPARFTGGGWACWVAPRGITHNVATGANRRRKACPAP